MSFPNTSSPPRYTLAAAMLSWFGVVVCSLLSVQSAAGGRALFCPRGFDCAAVLSSKFSTILGIPLPWLGATFYGLALVAMLLALVLSSAIWRKRVLLLTLWGAIGGLSFSAGLMYLQFFVLHAFCSLCTASAVILLLLTIATVLAVRYDPDEFRGGATAAVVISVFAVTSLLAFSLMRPANVGGEVVAEVNGRELLRRYMEEDIRKQVWPLKLQIHALEKEWVRTKARAAASAGTGGGLGVREFIPPTPRGPIGFEADSADVIGPADARVELVIFSDFTCKYCIQLDAVVRRIRAEFPEIKIVHYDFPISDDGPGFSAAMAGRCAAEQGAFWKFHDRAFAENGHLPPEKLLAIARDLGLDENRFSQCLQSEKAKSAVRASVEKGVGYGVAGAPSIFLNGTLVGGMVDYVTLRNSINARLRGGSEGTR